MQVVIELIVFAAGFTLVFLTIVGALRTFVLPRGDNVWLTRMVFRTLFGLFRFRLRRCKNVERVERILAFFAPTALFVLPIVWMMLVMAGFAAMFWAAGVEPIGSAILLSGSSLLTLGFATVSGPLQTALAFAAALIGLLMVALLIAYLPTIYSAFSRREAAVTLLEVRAGTPPWAITMIERYHRIHNLDNLNEQWRSWEIWFSEVEESHTTFVALPFFRSPQPHRSWVTASGAVLDAAALAASTLDIRHDPSADLCIRAGYLALRRIAELFRVPYNTDPHFGDPISVSRAEFDAACDRMAGNGIPIKPDREQAWRDFAGWRVTYDTVLVALAQLTLAPPSPWSGPRSPTYDLPIDDAWAYKRRKGLL